MLKNLVIMLGTILISTPAFVLANEEVCGPPPTKPENNCDNIPNLGADYRLDCHHRAEMDELVYEYTKKLRDDCLKLLEYEVPAKGPFVLYVYELRCTTPDTKIYGNNWFRGERVQTGGYSSDINGWVCDDVFVPETTNQYYDYPDYDGSICAAYLGNEIRIEPRLKCEIVRVPAPL